MTQQDKQREQVIQYVSELLRNNPFAFEFKVKKKPAGVKIIYEVTQEEMDWITKKRSVGQ